MTWSTHKLKRAILILAALLCLSEPIGMYAAQTQGSAPSYKIAGIKAMLFYDDTGKFSRDVLAKPNFTFWNTVIGEGNAEGPSNSTLVLIELAGDPTTSAPAVRKIELTATASGKVILKRTSSIGLFSRTGKFYAPFWLYETGCQPIKLTARVLGQSQPASLTRTIPFACGE